MIEHLNQPHIPSHTDYSTPKHVETPQTPDRSGADVTASMVEPTPTQKEERARRRRYRKHGNKINMDAVLTFIENSPGHRAKPIDIARGFGVETNGVSRTLGALADDGQIYRTKSGSWAKIGPDGERPDESKPRPRKQELEARAQDAQKSPVEEAADDFGVKHCPLVQALIEEIPGAGEPWTSARRAQWAAMAGHIFDYCYGVKHDG